MEIKTEFGTGAIKMCGGKPDISLVPPEMILAAARAFTHGADSGKYEAHNWAKGIPVSKLYASLQRHLLAWLAGEESDPDSKLAHLDHAAASLAMLVATVERGGQDDRYKSKEMK